MDLKTQQESKIYAIIRVRLMAAAEKYHWRSGRRTLSSPDDLAQDSLIQVMAFFANWETRYGRDFREDEIAFRAGIAWGVTCLRNAFIDETRAARIRPPEWTPVYEGEEPAEIPCGRASPEEESAARLRLRSVRKHIQSVHCDRYVDKLEEMLGNCADAAFNRRTLREELDLSPKQLQRIADEILRKGLLD
jgi:DNA-directed RNA polymerase specialized sigma24 family protein